MTPLLLTLFATAAAAQDAPAPGPVRFGGFLAQIDGLEEPSAVAVGPDERIYVVERFAHRVRVFDAEGKELLRLGAHGLAGGASGELLEPEGVAVAPDGTVLVADTGKRRIARFAADGTPGEVAWPRTERARTPLGLDVDAGELLVADPRRGALERLRLDAGDPRAAADAAPGSAGSSGSPGALGADAGLARPVDVAVGTAGELFVVDAGRHRVAVLDAQGRALRGWGDFGPYPGQLAAPSGIDVVAGRVYVADRDNHRIQVFDEAGARLYEWGVHALRPHEGDGRLHYPNDVAIAPSGRFAVVCEGFENRVQIFGAETDESAGAAASQERNTSAHFGFGVSTAGGLLALVEPGAPSVLVYDLRESEPIEITRFGMHGARTGRLLAPVDVELDPHGRRAFVADADARRIDVWNVERAPGEALRFDPLLARLVQSYAFAPARGSPAGAGSTVGPSVGNGVEPAALAADRAGGLWVVDAAGRALLRLGLATDARGGVAIDAGAPCALALGGAGDDAAPEGPALRIPTDVAVGRDGTTLFVVDAGEQRVETFAIEPGAGGPRLSRRASFGRRGAGPGELVRPSGICAGIDGFVYVTDEGGDRVLKFSEDGAFVAAWGRRGLGRVEFYKPRGITQDASGKLYVVDYGNHRGQVLTADGAFVVAFGARLFTQPTRTVETVK